MGIFVETFGAGALDKHIDEAIEMINGLPETTAKQREQLLRDFVESTGTGAGKEHFEAVAGEETKEEKKEEKK